jgi:Flp pilus assembly pilin Flp
MLRIIARAFESFRLMSRCEAGLASVEYTVIAASLGVTLIVGAFQLGPKIHAYLLYVEHVTAQGQATLASLPATP